MRKYIEYALIVKSNGELLPTIDGEEFKSGQFDERKLKEIKRYLRSAEKRHLEEREDFVDFGTALYEALLKPVEGCFDTTWKTLNTADDCYLRLRLIFEKTNDLCAELIDIPWEFLYYPDDETFLGTDPRVAFSCSYENWLNEPLEGYAVNELPLRVLLVHAHPENLAPVGFTELVSKKLSELNERVEISSLADPMPDELLQALRERKPHVLHFIGHGRHNALALRDKQSGNALWITDSSLCDQLRQTDVKLVVLQACESAAPAQESAFSGTAAQLVQRHLPAVVALRYPILQPLAWNFSKAFYVNLADEYPVDVVVQAGREILAVSHEAHSIRDFGSPVFWTRLRDGRLFPETRASQKQSEQTARETKIQKPKEVPHQHEIIGYLDEVIARYEELDKRYINLAGETEQSIIDREDSHFKGTSILIPPEFKILEENEKQEQTEKKSLEDIEDVLKIHHRFVLLGEPGSGKTSTLWKILISRAKLTKENPHLPIPLLINLAEWPEEDIADIPALFRHFRTQAGLPPLHFSRFMLLFDGLNEMRVKNYKKRVTAIQEWLQAHAKMSVIFACREKDFAKFRQISLPEVLIHRLDETRIKHFINAYLGEAEGKKLFELIRPKAGTRRRRRKYTREKRLAAKALIYLATNPYLLFMIIYTYHEKKEIPASRGQLFDKFVKFLYEREKRRNTTEGTSYDELLEVLSKIAFAMVNARSATIVHTAWAVKRLSESLDIPKVLRLSTQASLIKLTHSETVFQFTHQLLLEYFAATALLKRLSKLEKYLNKPQFRKNVRVQSHWDEVIYILVGIADANNIIRRISQIDPFLAANCLEYVPKDVTLQTDTVSALITRVISFFKARNASAQNAAIVCLEALGVQTVPFLIHTLEHDILIAQRLSLKVLAQFPHQEAIEPIFRTTEHSAKWVRRDAEDIIEHFSEAHFKVALKLLTRKLANKDERRGIRFMLNIVSAILESEHDHIILDTLQLLAAKEHIDFFSEALSQKAEDWEKQLVFEQLAHYLCLSKEGLSQNVLSVLTTLMNTIMESISERCQNKSDVEILTEYSWLLDVSGKFFFPERFYEKNNKLRAIIPFLKPVREGKVESSSDDFHSGVMTKVTIEPLQCGEELDAIHYLLNSQDANVRIKALNKISKFTSHMNPEIIFPLLRDPHPKIRIQALRTLSQVKNNFDSEILEPLLDDLISEVRIEALKAISQSRSRIDPEVLYGLLNDKVPEVKIQLIKTLLQLEKISEPEIFYPLLCDPDFKVRIQASEAISQLNRSQSFEYLYSLLNHPNSAYRAQALKDLLNLKDEPKFRNLHSPSPKIRKQALEALLPINNEFEAEILYFLLNDTNQEIRVRSLKALSLLGEEIKTERLYPLLKNDPVLKVKRQALEVLLKADNKFKSKLFHYMLNESNPHVREIMLEALLNSKEPIELKNLLSLLNDSYYKVRLQILNFLLQLDEEFSPNMLSPLLQDSFAIVRHRTLQVMLKFDEIPETKILYPLLEDPFFYIRVLAVQGIIRFDKTSAVVPLLLPLLRDDSEQVISEVVKALVHLSNLNILKAEDAIEKILDGDDERLKAKLERSLSEENSTSPAGTERFEN